MTRNNYGQNRKLIGSLIAINISQLRSCELEICCFFLHKKCGWGLIEFIKLPMDMTPLMCTAKCTPFLSLLASSIATEITQSGRCSTLLIVSENRHSGWWILNLVCTRSLECGNANQSILYQSHHTRSEFLNSYNDEWRSLMQVVLKHYHAVVWLSRCETVIVSYFPWGWLYNNYVVCLLRHIRPCFNMTYSPQRKNACDKLPMAMHEITLRGFMRDFHLVAKNTSWIDTPQR